MRKSRDALIKTCLWRSGAPTRRDFPRRNIVLSDFEIGGDREADKTNAKETLVLVILETVDFFTRAVKINMCFNILRAFGVSGVLARSPMNGPSV